MPIYLVQNNIDPVQKVLVNAGTKSGALAHVARQTMTVSIMNATEVVSHMMDGVQVETANPKPEEETE